MAKRGVRVPIFVLRVGVRVSFGGRNPHRTATGFGAGSGPGPTSPATSVLIPVPPRPWGEGANRAPTAPPIVATVGRGGETGPDFTPLVSLPWRRAANPAPNVPPVFATVGRGPDCTGGASGPRKGGYPLSHVPYSRRRTGTSPLPDPPAAALVWVPCTAWNAIRETPALRSVPPRTPGSGFSDIRGAFLGSSGTCFASEGNREHPRPSPIRAIPRIWKGPQKTPTAKMRTPGHTSSHPHAHKDTRNAHEKSCVRTSRSCAAHAAHTKPPCMVRGLHTAPEGLRVDPAGDHLRSKVDPAAGEVHDEGGPSRFFHNRRPNRAPSKAGGSKPFDNPLGASAKGRRPSLIRVARLRRSHKGLSGPTEGRHSSHADRDAVNLRRRRLGPLHPAVSQDGKNPGGFSNR